MQQQTPENTEITTVFFYCILEFRPAPPDPPVILPPILRPLVPIVNVDVEASLRVDKLISENNQLLFYSFPFSPVFLLNFCLLKVDSVVLPLKNRPSVLKMQVAALLHYALIFRQHMTSLSDIKILSGRFFFFSQFVIFG